VTPSGVHRPRAWSRQRSIRRISWVSTARRAPGAAARWARSSRVACRARLPAWSPTRVPHGVVGAAGQPGVVGDVGLHQLGPVGEAGRGQVGPAVLQHGPVPVDPDGQPGRPGQEPLHQQRPRAAHQVGDPVGGPRPGQAGHGGGDGGVGGPGEVADPPGTVRQRPGGQPDQHVPPVGSFDGPAEPEHQVAVVLVVAQSGGGGQRLGEPPEAAGGGAGGVEPERPRRRRAQLPDRLDGPDDLRQVLAAGQRAWPGHAEGEDGEGGHDGP
jgi:hypothetical protein